MSLPVGCFYALCVLAGLGAGGVCWWAGYQHGRWVLARALNKAMRDEPPVFFITCDKCKGTGREGPLDLGVRT